ncbi:hypothetical protein D5H75_10895 [Bailinhaonella thermotolerans]|uniref:Pyrrolo-quinoline quinone repeat domain-containing protein n=1 Tax=Bailinhaonella thermotolerans TaxID=1070861 RepID=A0A3A4AZ10_9ACTN|nr:hypothetical protein D5H75_10895 [Bailinhaonella thermotolerans]
MHPSPRKSSGGVLLAAGALVAAASGCSGSDAEAKALSWHNPHLNAISRPVGAGGVSAVTGLRPDGTLETVAVETATGKRLWAYPATMAGRLPGLGVQAPAVAEDGGRPVVAAVEPLPRKRGRWNALLVAREGRTGARLWERPVHSTFGPQRCGTALCVSEHTALRRARFVALDPATGRELWRVPGVADVAHADSGRVVLLRLVRSPLIEARDLATGKAAWRLPVEAALGRGVDLSGGWSFGTAGGDLVTYVAPYTDPRTRRVSPFGMFSARLADGRLNWMRPSVVRVYPSGSPGVAPVVRPVDQNGRYGGFAHLDARSGRVIGQITAQQVPGSGWWLAFPNDLSVLGFLKHNAEGAAYDLRTGARPRHRAQRGWSFCVTDPAPAPIKGQPGFYSIAALCEFDLATGKRTKDSTSPPPAWFTGGDNGWRLWRDQKGGLHALKDGTATSPGMYG